MCECVSAVLVRGNDCYYSRAWEADACCLRNQTCYVSMRVLWCVCVCVQDASGQIHDLFGNLRLLHIYSLAGPPDCFNC